MNVGVAIAPIARRTAAPARTAEDLGFGSIRVPDSQNLAPEVWGQLMLAAQATSTIELGTGAKALLDELATSTRHEHDSR
ncbi:MAG TPA: hypothetical protein VL403_10390 [Candidatus Kryptonia bacterium]|nr:hypothetical protein [Candidatus Kryptonia bacterium]